MRNARRSALLLLRCAPALRFRLGATSGLRGVEAGNLRVCARARLRESFMGAGAGLVYALRRAARRARLAPAIAAMEPEFAMSPRPAFRHRMIMDDHLAGEMDGEVRALTGTRHGAFRPQASAMSAALPCW